MILEVINPNKCECCKKLIIGRVFYARYPVPMCGGCYQGLTVYQERMTQLMTITEVAA